MDVIRLCHDFNVTYVTEGKNCAPGWINLNCPFCNDDGNHLGYNLSQDYVHCWKCGHHQVSEVFGKLLNMTEGKAWALMQQYGGSSAKKVKEPIVKIRAKAHKLPSGTGPMGTIHRIYLQRRRFDPEALESQWGLLGTGPISLLDGIDYKFRIIAPITWNDEEVSFQGRDITGKHTLRYITCPKERELMRHKHILYGKQDEWTDTGICVEGITKVWRLGIHAFATFGIEYTPTQVRVMAKNFKRIAVVFDPEPQAQRQAEKLVAMLKFRNVDAWNIDIGMDPGDLKQSDADALVKLIMK
jgi:hypothetical protein